MVGVRSHRVAPPLASSAASAPPPAIPAVPDAAETDLEDDIRGPSRRRGTSVVHLVDAHGQHEWRGRRLIRHRTTRRERHERRDPLRALDPGRGSRPVPPRGERRHRTLAQVIELTHRQKEPVCQRTPIDPGERKRRITQPSELRAALCLVDRAAGGGFEHVVCVELQLFRIRTRSSRELARQRTA